MTNEEVMQLMTDMGLHEGGIDNWVMDNAWVLVVNKAIEKEREACAKVCEEYETDNDITATWLNIIADAIRARGQA